MFDYRGLRQELCLESSVLSISVFLCSALAVGVVQQFIKMMEVILIAHLAVVYPQLLCPDLSVRGGTKTLFEDFPQRHP